MALFTLSGINAQNHSDKKILVAYFSCTGTTEKVAGGIAEAVNGTLYRITPATPYTAADLDWHDRNSRSSVEMNNATSRPPIKDNGINPSDYDIIFIGYPIWWDLCPRSVNTFLDTHNLAGKTIIPFATSGGSTITGSVKDLHRLYSNLLWREGKLLNGTPKQAGTWAISIVK